MQQHRNNCHLVPMLDALRAPPVPPGRDMQASEDLFMDLDEQPSKRSRDTTSGLRSLTSPIPMSLCKELKTSVFPLPRTPEQPVPAPETPFQPVPHGNVAPETPQCARDAACGKLENCSTCAIILTSCLTSDAQHVCSSIHVARGFCCHD